MQRRVLGGLNAFIEEDLAWLVHPIVSRARRTGRPAVSAELIEIVAKRLEATTVLPGELVPYQKIDVFARVTGFVESVAGGPRLNGQKGANPRDSLGPGNERAAGRSERTRGRDRSGAQ